MWPFSQIKTSEAGDTLLEVVIAVIVIAITAAALLGALTTSIMSSAAHRDFATEDTVLQSYAEEVQYQVGQDYSTCAQINPTPTPSTYNGAPIDPTTTLPSGYSVEISQIQYWGNPTALTSPMTAGSSYTTLNVNALTAPMSPGDTIVIGTSVNGQTISNTATVAASANVGDISIAISSFTPTTNFPASSTWLYDEDNMQFTPTCAASALRVFPGNDIQQLTIAVTAPNGITDDDSIVVGNPNYV
jgi:Tfp pilus assembly protein PilV